MNPDLDRYLLAPMMISVWTHQPVHQHDGEGHLMAATGWCAPGGHATLVLHAWARRGEEKQLPRWTAHVRPAYDSGGWGLPPLAEYFATVTIPVLSVEGRSLDVIGAHVFIGPRSPT